VPVGKVDHPGMRALSSAYKEVSGKEAIKNFGI